MKRSSLAGHTVEVYSEITASQKPADRSIDQFFRNRKYLGSHDRRFISETVYGMLRHKKRLEWSIRSAGVTYTDLLHCAAYLMLQQQHGSVNELALDLDIPNDVLSAVSQSVQRTPDGANEHEVFAITYSFQEWMIAEWMSRLDKTEVEALCTVLNTQAPMTVRVNTLKTTRLECQKKLLEEGIETEQTSLSPFGLQLKKRVNLFQLQSFKNGLFEVQDEGSQLLAMLVDPKPSSKVIDACAGAGGKALALASIMKNRGEIFAFDVHSSRLDEMKKRQKRGGVDSIRSKVIKENEFIQNYKESADIVLVDAPCTGTGTIRRNPGMKWSVSETMVEELHHKQHSILSLNAGYVKAGGKIVYATCSLMKHENEDVVERFLNGHPNFQPVGPGPTLERYSLGHVGTDKYFSLLPHRHQTDGFFAAVMKRTE